MHGWKYAKFLVVFHLDLLEVGKQPLSIRQLSQAL